MTNFMYSHSHTSTIFIGKSDRGFSLIEMAIVLFIVAMLLGGLLPVVSSQIDLKRRNDTRKQLDEIQQALIGYAIINGRLPCPASENSNGLESFCTTPNPGMCGGETFPPAVPLHGRCFRPFDGFVPAATLGITPVNAQGFMIDGWNNRIHYAVTTVSVIGIQTFTAPNAMSVAGIAGLTTSDLHVCASTPIPLNPSLPALNCGASPPNVILTSTAPAVIYSTGENGNFGGSGNDELANSNPFPNPTLGPNNSYEDNVFVSHDQTSAFDDIVVWLSPNVLINRMVNAGKLP